MVTQTQSGKAFEYALLIALQNKVNNGQKIKIQKDNSYKIAKESFESCLSNEQRHYFKAATVAIKHIGTIEPRLENPINSEEIVLSIQADQKGEDGDIRDILMVRTKSNWEIGFSAKNENSAVKHSRLSDKIDFGQKWFGVNCSESYMSVVGVIFGKIRKLMRESRMNGDVLLWSDVPKISDYYVPVLEAFEKEICSLIKSNKDIPLSLLEYLIGKNDFYKIMKFKDIVTIQGYNLHETLNMSSNSINPQNKVSKLKFPTEIISVTRNDNNKTIITFDKGWQISFRIHSASSKAEPSLKFDVRLEGVPPSLYSHNELW
ncbi:MAG: HaeIII family restriction endonuclease [Nitrosopumilus sp.]|nr:HaeIII family restriction endonuclease [Nitrosopumilus sp.]NRA05662.1 HaeIII family restriction endonuclease [Nitrosopumilus sp.]